MSYSLPQLYDVLYGFKDYAAESASVTRRIRERNPTARTLLDVACGTGRHLEYLRHEFDVEGADFEPGLLAVARERLGEGVPLHKADMRTLELGRRFDAVTCLFSAIGHVADLAELHSAIAAMVAHLEPGGVLLVEPWLEPDVWEPGKLTMLTVDEPDLKISRMSMAGREGIISTIDFHFLVGTPEGFETHLEHMELALFTAAELRHAFEAAGLETEHDAEGLTGRGLFRGVRPTTE